MIKGNIFQTFAALTTFFLLSTTNSQAISLKVYEEVLSFDDPLTRIEARFRINSDHPELGRAWIEVTASHEIFFSERETERTVANKNIPGLKYDAKAGQVLFEQPNAAPVICAQVTESHFFFFKSKEVEPTGNCILTTALTAREQGDGTKAKKQPIAQVSLELMSSDDTTRHPASDAPASSTEKSSGSSTTARDLIMRP